MIFETKDIAVVRSVKYFSYSFTNIIGKERCSSMICFNCKSKFILRTVNCLSVFIFSLNVFSLLSKLVTVLLK